MGVWIILNHGIIGSSILASIHSVHCDRGLAEKHLERLYNKGYMDCQIIYKRVNFGGRKGA